MTQKEQTRNLQERLDGEGQKSLGDLLRDYARLMLYPTGFRDFNNNVAEVLGLGPTVGFVGRGFGTILDVVKYPMYAGAILYEVSKYL